MSITLNHLAQGVPVVITALNSIGTNQSIIIAATDPAGASFTTVQGVHSSGAGSGFVNLLTGAVLNTGNVFIFAGSAPTPGTLNLAF